MKNTAILIAALLCAAPAWAQEGQTEISNLNAGPGAGPDLHAAVVENARRATQALRANDFRTARRYAQLVTRGDPGNPEAWLMLGAAQRGLMDWKGARASYGMALRMAPTGVAAHAGLGVALARLGDAGAAKELAWLAAKADTCAANCAAIAAGRSDVAAAMAAGGGKPG